MAMRLTSKVLGVIDQSMDGVWELSDNRQVEAVKKRNGVVQGTVRKVLPYCKLEGPDRSNCFDYKARETKVFLKFKERIEEAEEVVDQRFSADLTAKRLER